MKLYRLKLKNFKGIKDFTLDVAGKNASIYADNAVGKTSLFDAFCWILFDKDSTGKKDFAIKTLDASGKEINMLEHEVEAVLDVDGKLVTLRKVYKEKWTKKKGNPTPEFTGHETDYFIDGVPAKKSEYMSKINEIANEDAFKLLTSPSYFNEQLHWEKRRKIILGVCGDISDAEVIESNTNLAKLPDILGDRSLEDHKKVIAARKTELNKAIESIPTRVDEVHRGLPDISGLNEMDICYNISTEKENLQKANENLLQLQSGGEVAQKKIHLTTIEAEIQKLKNAHQIKIDKQISDKRIKLSDADLGRRTLHNEITTKESTITNNQRKIDANKKEAGELKTKWYAERDIPFEIEVESVCPTCGQDIPEEKIIDTRTNAEAKFNLEKSSRLEAITMHGKALMTDVKVLEEQNAELKTEIETLKTKLTQENEEAVRLANEINAIAQSDILSNHQPYIDLLKKKSNLEQSIENVNQDNSEIIEKAKQDVADVEKCIADLDISIAQIKQCEAGQKRITELKDQEKKLATEYSKLEKELFLAEEFIRTKVSMLEGKIGEHFKMTRFKMFNQQVNGGIEECCEALVNTNGAWVPYASANNAGRINSGMDCINTLSEHHGFIPPIFIDNAESISRIIDTNAQVIKLIKPPKFDDLEKDVQNSLVSKFGSVETARSEYDLKNQTLRVMVELENKSNAEVI